MISNIGVTNCNSENTFKASISFVQFYTHSRKPTWVYRVEYDLEKSTLDNMWAWNTNVTPDQTNTLTVV